MRVDIETINSSFLNLIERPDQIVFLDANFFIPPDRSDLPSNQKIKPYSFADFKKNWLEPLLAEFSGISIHESVFEELVEAHVKDYADSKNKANPSRLRIYLDSELTENEKNIMRTVIDRLAIHSQYDPDRNNAKDRGEILSLSYMSVKGFLFFAAKDELPIRLINDADKLDTGLDDMGIIQMYELIYYLHKTDKYDGKALRILYKYLYYLTSREKKQNPEWGTFIQKMDDLYSELIQAHMSKE